MTNKQIKKCDNYDDLCNKYYETESKTYKDGWLIKTDYYCAKCGRLIFSEIE